MIIAAIFDVPLLVMGMTDECSRSGKPCPLLSCHADMFLYHDWRETSKKEWPSVQSVFRQKERMQTRFLNCRRSGADIFVDRSMTVWNSDCY